MKKLFEIPELECYKMLSEAVTENGDGSVEGSTGNASMPEGWV